MGVRDIIISWIFLVVLTTLILYGFFSFTLWNADVALWTVKERMTLCILVFLDWVALTVLAVVNGVPDEE